MNTARQSAATRQQIRHELRQIAFRNITAQFPGETRRTRRAMSATKGNREYRQQRGLPEPLEAK